MARSFLRRAVIGNRTSTSRRSWRDPVLPSHTLGCQHLEVKPTRIF